MMQQGFQDREGRDVQGMREMLEKLRERRREQLDRYDLGGVYEDIANRLDEIVDAGARRHRPPPRRSARSRATSAARSCSKSSRSERREQLEQLPPDLAGRVSELQQYDWMDDAARQQFEELMEELKKQLLDSMFNQLQQGMSEMSPEQLAAHEGHARRAQPHARAARARARSPTSKGSWSASATSSRTTRRRSTSCSSRWRARWRRCSSCSTRCRPSSARSCRSSRTRCSTTWTCAGRSTSSARTCATRSRRWVGASACAFRGDEPMPLEGRWAACSTSSATSTRSRT